MKNTSSHRVVIVGGGTAGLALASKLGRKYRKTENTTVTLVDQNLTHIWKPLLHEVAAGSFDSHVNEISFLAQAKRCGFEFRLGTLQSIDRKEKHISLEALLDDNKEEQIPIRTINYDTLVLAVGSVSNDFGVPGVDEHCLYLDTTQQAENFHKNLIQAYSRIFTGGGQEVLPMRISIIGAGATGVELSAQLREVSDLLNSYVDRKVELQITLVEGADRILPGLPEYLSEATQKQLENLNISVLTNETVKRVTGNTVETGSGAVIHSDIHVWAAGIKAPDALNNCDHLEANRINQVSVKPTLQTTLDDSIFAIGDCAACKWTEDSYVPPRAQSAHQQATLLSKSIPKTIEGKRPGNFHYKDYGSLVSLGGHSTVGNMMGNLMKDIRIEGFVARMVYLSLYKMHQVSLFGIWRTGMLTISNVFRRSVHPVIKLH